MSEEYIVKQIEVLVAMLGEERLDIEKQIIDSKIVELYKLKVDGEMRKRLTAE